MSSPQQFVSLDALRYEPIETDGPNKEWLVDSASRGAFHVLHHKQRHSFGGLKNFLFRKGDSDSDAFRICFAARPFYCFASCATRTEILDVLEWLVGQLGWHDGLSQGQLEENGPKFLAQFKKVLREIKLPGMNVPLAHMTTADLKSLSSTLRKVSVSADRPERVMPAIWNELANREQQSMEDRFMSRQGESFPVSVWYKDEQTGQLDNMGSIEVG